MEPSIAGCGFCSRTRSGAHQELASQLRYGGVRAAYPQREIEFIKSFLVLAHLIGDPGEIFKRLRMLRPQLVGAA